jgi:hypothetical protein
MREKEYRLTELRDADAELLKGDVTSGLQGVLEVEIGLIVKTPDQLMFGLQKGILMDP